MAKAAQTDVYVANSESTERRAREWLGIEPSGVVYAGVDVNKFSPESEAAIDTNESIILYVGRLDEGKGLPDLMHAVAQLESEPLFYLVGEGTLQSTLQTMVDDLEMRDQVEFTGAIPHSDIHHYYAAADIFCLPSYHEGFPVVNMEAMATGLPVVSTRIEAVEDQIDDGIHGFLVEPGDIDGLASALSNLLAASELRSQLGQNGRERAEAQFTWDAQTVNMREHYTKVA